VYRTAVGRKDRSFFGVVLVVSCISNDFDSNDRSLLACWLSCFDCAGVVPIEIIEGAIAYMSFWMYSLHEMEQALDHCYNNNKKELCNDGNCKL
jgi:hypothetical protein